MEEIKRYQKAHPGAGQVPGASADCGGHGKKVLVGFNNRADQGNRYSGSGLLPEAESGERYGKLLAAKEAELLELPRRPKNT